MPIELPAIPAGVLTLLGLFSPYLIAVVNRPEWPQNTKRLISVAASLILSLIALAFYYVLSGEALPEWPVLLLLGLLVSQASYALIAKPLGAAAVEAATSPSPHNL